MVTLELNGGGVLSSSPAGHCCVAEMLLDGLLFTPSTEDGCKVALCVLCA